MFLWWRYSKTGQISLDTEGHLLRILSFWTGHCRCSPFHFTKHFSPSLAENCLRLDNSFAQQGQSSGLVLLRHKDWKLQMRTWELKAIYMKNPKSKGTKDNCKRLSSYWSRAGLHQVGKSVKDSTDGKLTWGNSTEAIIRNVSHNSVKYH